MGTPSFAGAFNPSSPSPVGTGQAVATLSVASSPSASSSTVESHSRHPAVAGGGGERESHGIHSCRASLPAMVGSNISGATVSVVECPHKELDQHGMGEHAEIVQLLKELSVSRQGRDMKLALVLMALAFLVMLGAFLGAVVFAMHITKEQTVDAEDVLTSTKDGRPLRIQQHYQYIGLHDINRMPLDQIEQMQSLVLQWGQPGSGREKQYFYNIQSALRDAATNTTTLNLSSDHRLIASGSRAVLLDKNQKQIGVLDFSKGMTTASGSQLPLLPNQEKGEGNSTASHSNSSSSGRTSAGKHNETGSSDSSTSAGAGISSPSTENAALKRGSRGEAVVERGGEERRLGRLIGGGQPNSFGRYPRNAYSGEPESFFDAYCRYGCGKLAVTFPYYYRPFFGYGFPLVGTQAMFPQGYGGYPGADLLAHQGAGVVQSQGGTVAALGARRR